VQIEDSMFHFLDTDRPRFWSAFALNLAAHSLSAFEVLLGCGFWARADRHLPRCSSRV
jgi:hypothetical protein